MRHLTQKYEAMFGKGLTGLIHPVTKEFNHKAMIELRGGVGEPITTLGNLGIHRLLAPKACGPGIPFEQCVITDDGRKIRNVAEKTFNSYDIISFWYGWTLALTDGDDASGAQKCFVALFDTVNVVDYFLIDLKDFFTKWFDILSFYPVNIGNNFAVSYQ